MSVMKGKTGELEDSADAVVVDINALGESVSKVFVFCWIKEKRQLVIMSRIVLFSFKNELIIFQLKSLTMCVIIKLNELYFNKVVWPLCRWNSIVRGKFHLLIKVVWFNFQLYSITCKVLWKM